MLFENDCLDDGLAVISDSRGRSAARETLFLRLHVDGLFKMGRGNRICSGWYMIARYQWKLCKGREQGEMTESNSLLLVDRDNYVLLAEYVKLHRPFANAFVPFSCTVMHCD